MIELSFWKLINHQRRTASLPAMRMLLEKKPVSKGKVMFFTLACCFVHEFRETGFPSENRVFSPSAKSRVPGGSVQSEVWMARAPSAQRGEMAHAMQQLPALTCCGYS
jgi:hypothetical protein